MAILHSHPPFPPQLSSSPPLSPPSHPSTLHSGAPLIRIEEAPPPFTHHPPPSKFPPSFLPLHLNCRPFLFYTSHHSTGVRLISPIFKQKRKLLTAEPFLSPPENLGATGGLALTPRLCLLFLLLFLHRYTLYLINQSPSLTFQLSSPASYHGPETKQAPSALPLRPTHRPTLQLPTGPGRLIFLRCSVSNRPP